MTHVCLRASLPASLVLLLLAVGSASAQTATTAAPGLSVAPRMATAAAVQTADGFVSAAAGYAGDEQRKPAAPQPDGPMTVVPVRNAFVVAPEVRFGRVNHRSATIVGATGGILMNNQLFLGVGGYWLAQGAHSVEAGMEYGGGVVGWYLKGDGPIDLRLTALIGGGWSTIGGGSEPVPLGMDSRMPQMYPQPRDSWRHSGYTGNGFFVAEPGASLCIRISRRLWINAGVGYRFVSRPHGLDSDLRGVTGSMAVTFGHR